MANKGEGGESSPHLTKVNFDNNSANDYGGAIYNDGYPEKSNPKLTEVTFNGNFADDGGAMYNERL